ncbi:SDR family oxidoreductase [Sphingomonas sp. GC_Shp_1]|uniref:SDR family oxidoreductase n=1 Tax=unclassified Sphingomonas TaxID=196159 RepID=UPI00226A78C7
MGSSTRRWTHSGELDVILNNAGILPLSPLERLTIADWDRMTDVNAKGMLYGIAAVLPHMERQMSGHIINVPSVAGFKVIPTSSVYSANKTAVRVISGGLCQEVKPYNIRTTMISPGATDTERPGSVTDRDITENVRALFAVNTGPADTFARTVAFAIEQSEDVDVNEILFRPTNHEL